MYHPDLLAWNRREHLLHKTLPFWGQEYLCGGEAEQRIGAVAEEELQGKGAQQKAHVVRLANGRHIPPPVTSPHLLQMRQLVFLNCFCS